MGDRPTCPGCRVEMDLVSMRADGEGCDWLCWGCWYRDNPNLTPSTGNQTGAPE